MLPEAKFSNIRVHVIFRASQSLWGFFKFCLILEGPMPLTSGIIIYSGRFCCTLFYIFGILQQS